MLQNFNTGTTTKEQNTFTIDVKHGFLNLRKTRIFVSYEIEKCEFLPQSTNYDMFKYGVVHNVKDYNMRYALTVVVGKNEFYEFLIIENYVDNQLYYNEYILQTINLQLVDKLAKIVTYEYYDKLLSKIYLHEFFNRHWKLLEIIEKINNFEKINNGSDPAG